MYFVFRIVGTPRTVLKSDGLRPLLSLGAVVECVQSLIWMRLTDGHRASLDCSPYKMFEGSLVCCRHQKI